MELLGENPVLGRLSWQQLASLGGKKKKKKKTYEAMAMFPA